MKLPVQITFKNCDHSDALETDIRERLEKLDHNGRLIGARVVVEMPQRRHQQGKLFNLRLDLTIPGSEIVVNHNEHEDVHVAMRDAFDDAKRQLDDFIRKQRDHDHA